MRLDIQPGGEWLLPFARKKIKELHAELIRQNRSNGSRFVYVTTDETVFIQSQKLMQMAGVAPQFLDSIRITAGSDFDIYAKASGPIKYYLYKLGSIKPKIISTVLNGSAEDYVRSLKTPGAVSFGAAMDAHVIAAQATYDAALAQINTDFAASGLSSADFLLTPVGAVDFAALNDAQAALTAAQTLYPDGASQYIKADASKTAVYGSANLSANFKTLLESSSAVSVSKIGIVPTNASGTKRLLTDGIAEREITSNETPHILASDTDFFYYEPGNTAKQIVSLADGVLGTADTTNTRFAAAGPVTNHYDVCYAITDGNAPFGFHVYIGNTEVYSASPPVGQSGSIRGIVAFKDGFAFAYDSWGIFNLQATGNTGITETVTLVVLRRQVQPDGSYVYVATTTVHTLLNLDDSQHLAYIKVGAANDGAAFAYVKYVYEDGTFTEHIRVSVLTSTGAEVIYRDVAGANFTDSYSPYGWEQFDSFVIFLADNNGTVAGANFFSNNLVLLKSDGTFSEFASPTSAFTPQNYDAPARYVRGTATHGYVVCKNLAGTACWLLGSDGTNIHLDTIPPVSGTVVLSGLTTTKTNAYALIESSGTANRVYHIRNDAQTLLDTYTASPTAANEAALAVARFEYQYQGQLLAPRRAQIFRFQELDSWATP